MSDKDYPKEVAQTLLVKVLDIKIRKMQIIEFSSEDGDRCEL